MYDVSFLNDTMDRVKKIAEHTLTNEKSAHDVLTNEINRMAPALILYRTKKTLPPLAELEKFAGRIIAIVSASHEVQARK
jgi:hypothetical protein